MKRLTEKPRGFIDMENSKIEWTDHTFNIVHGCTKVSPACQNCYAEAFSHRLGKDLWGIGKERQVMSERYWRQPLKWNQQADKQGVRKRVFCSSMADVFEDHPTVNQERAKLWNLIEQTPNLDWLLLTKRPENFGRFLPWTSEHAGEYRLRYWPNVWLGTTVENQEWANKRIPKLLEVPAKVHFLSCEPLLGAIDLTYCNTAEFEYVNVLQPHQIAVDHSIYENRPGIDWVIVGGESGHGARPMHPSWVRSLRDQCVAASVPFFFKQWGEFAPICEMPNGDAPGCSDYHKDASRVVLQIDGRIENAFPAGAMTMFKIGKKLAGRLIDGRMCNELPEVTNASA